MVEDRGDFLFRCTCGLEVPHSERSCPACGRDVGFPNVRLAQMPSEADELARRYATALSSAQARGVAGRLEAFAAAVDRSFAIMNRSLGVIHAWLNGNNPLLATYHAQ